MAGGLEPDDLEGPFQPKPFHDSMIGHFCYKIALVLFACRLGPWGNTRLVGAEMAPVACWPLSAQLGTVVCCTQPGISPLPSEKDLPLPSLTDLPAMSCTGGETRFFCS